MPLEDDVEIENYEEDEVTNTTPSDRLNKQIEELKGSIDNQTNVTSLLQIPGVREAMEAHEKGESVEQPSVASVATPKSYDGKTPDEMSGEEFMEFINDKVSDTVMNKVDTKFEEMNSNLQGVSDFISEQRQTNANKALDDVRKRHPDMDKYLPQMQEIFTGNPGLSLERLYTLARIEASDDGVLREQGHPERTASERPSSRPVRPRQSGKVGNKRSDFSAMLQDATGKHTLDFGE